MTEKKKFLDANGILYFWNKIKSLISTKVDKVDGKGLSTNDFTTVYKNKIDEISGVLSRFTGRYSDLTNKPSIANLTIDGNITLEQLTLATGYAKQSDVTRQIAENKTYIDNKTFTKDKITNFPTNISDFANDSGFVNNSTVSSMISSAISQISHFHFEKVERLPEVSAGKDNIIYLVANPDGVSFTEYLFVDNKFEVIGNTDINIRDYVKNSDLVAFTNQDIDDIIAGVFQP